MPLSAGDKLRPYEILAPIGAGGMGEVWKARDTRLNRVVAIKFSQEQFSERFEREARAVAALNHPNICQLYDVGPNYLVMEYIEGTAVAPVDGPRKLLDLAVQIADGLAAAHAASIVHRDLKPDNILVTRDGRVKILDFGLAKATASSESDATRTMALTDPGSTVGTVNYMSPEQARGTTDLTPQSDQFSFGLVLYELAAAKRPFQRGSAAETMTAIIREEAEPLPSSIPAPLRWVIERLMAKEPAERYDSTRDLYRELRQIRDRLSQATSAVETSSAALPPKRHRILSFALTAVVCLALGALLAMQSAVTSWAPWRKPPVEEGPVQFQINPPPGVTFRLGVVGGSAISPDGRMIAVVGASGKGSKLWLRSLDAVNPRELPFTEGAMFPFGSPDSRSIAFFTEGKLKRIDLSGGAAFDIADAPTGRGGTWNSEGIIVFAPTVAGRLMRVSAAGGPPSPATESDPGIAGIAHRWPEFLPDGRHFLFFGTGNSNNESAGAYLGSLDLPRGKATRLVTTFTNVAYSSLPGQRGGYLLWSRGSTLMAQAFDSGRGQLSGDPVPIPGLGPMPNATLYRSFSVSRNGTILVERGDQPYQLTWFDRQGRPLNKVGRVDKYYDVHLAPDGNGAAVTLVDSSGNRDIWALDFARTAYTRLTSGSIGFVAAWSLNGKRVAYHSANLPFLYARNANGTGQEEKLLESRFAVYINDWSPDGRYVVYTESTPETQYDLWLLPTFGDRKPFPFLKTPAAEWQGQISPDGKWIAYTSDDSGSPDVYVRSFPDGASKWPVSTGGGGYPRWRRDGKELFYRAPDGLLMAVTARPVGQGLDFGSPVALFRLVEPLGAFAYPYDVSLDGQRILALAASQGTSDIAPLTVLINWQAGLKK